MVLNMFGAREERLKNKAVTNTPKKKLKNPRVYHVVVFIYITL